MEKPTKTIQITPSLFKIGKNRHTRRRREKKQKPDIKNRTISSRSLRKKLLERIKNHNEQKKTSNKVSVDINNVEDSLKYLEKRMREHKKKKQEKELQQIQTQAPKPQLVEITPFSKEEPLNNVISQSTPQNNSIQPINNITNNVPITSLSNNTTNQQVSNVQSFQVKKTIKRSIDRPNPPYGILKGGKKPLYSTWKKSLKQNREKREKQRIEQIKPKINILSPIKIEQPPHIIERKRKLEELKSKIKINNNKPIKPHRKIKRKTKKIKRVLGKHKGKNKITVLVKNKQTQKRIKQTKDDLKKHTIRDIKIDLKKRGLLKIGSNCPDDILRKLYEDSNLSGDIMNKSYDVLYHNYMNEEKDSSSS